MPEITLDAPIVTCVPCCTCVDIQFVYPNWTAKCVEGSWAVEWSGFTDVPQTIPLNTWTDVVDDPCQKTYTGAQVEYCADNGNGPPAAEPVADRPAAPGGSCECDCLQWHEVYPNWTATCSDGSWSVTFDGWTAQPNTTPSSGWVHVTGEPCAMTYSGGVYRYCSTDGPPTFEIGTPGEPPASCDCEECQDTQYVYPNWTATCSNGTWSVTFDGWTPTPNTTPQGEWVYDTEDECKKMWTGGSVSYCADNGGQPPTVEPDDTPEAPGDACLCAECGSECWRKIEAVWQCVNGDPNTGEWLEMESTPCDAAGECHPSNPWPAYTPGSWHQVYSSTFMEGEYTITWCKFVYVQQATTHLETNCTIENACPCEFECVEAPARPDLTCDECFGGEGI